MGGRRRDPNENIFTPAPKLVVKPKRQGNQPERPPTVAPSWVDLEELAFGKKKPKG